MTSTPDDAAEEITFVGPAAAAARMAELLAGDPGDPGRAARVAEILAEMDAADRAAAKEREHPGRDGRR